MKVLKDSFIYLIGELFAKSLPFLMLPYLTRKLGPEGFGELSYYLTWLALFGIFVGLSQEGAVTRYYYFYGKKALNSVVKAGYLVNITISLLLLIGCWWLKAEILAYIVFATMFQSFINVQLALQQCQKQSLKYITIQIIWSVTSVLFTIAALEYFTEELVTYRIFAIVTANLITFLIASLVLNNLFKDNHRLTWKRLKLGFVYIFSFGFPLILHQSSFFIKGQLDRIFIYEQYSKYELGLYSVGVQIAGVLPIIIMALNKAIVPYYYESLKNKLLVVEKIKKYASFSFILCLLPSMVFMLIPANFYNWFLGEGYSDAKIYTVMYLFGYSINIPYLFLVNYLFFYQRNKLISIVTFLSSLVYILLLIIFSSYSIVFVPFALIFSNIFMVVILWFYVKEIV